MKKKLPAPSPDPSTYKRIVESGLNRFSKRKKNFEKNQQKNRSVYVDCLPTSMDFEVVSRCNFRCLMCMVSEFPGGKRAADMPFEKFEKILNEQYGLIEIKLQGLGEPLLHPRIFDMITLAKDRDIWTRLTVNGSLLHINENYKRLIDSDPGEIQISIDGADEKVFESIRKGSNFKKIVENVTNLNSYEHSKNVLKTRSWTLVQAYNIHQLKDIIQLGEQMKFRRMTFSIAISDFATKEWHTKNKKIETDLLYFEQLADEMIDLGLKYGIEITFWDGSSKFSLSGDLSTRCSWLWERSYISSDLKVVPCCVISNPDTINFGDASLLNEIWNGDKYQKIRKLHIDGNIPDFCKQCYGIKD